MGSHLPTYADSIFSAKNLTITKPQIAEQKYPRLEGKIRVCYPEAVFARPHS